MPSPPLLHSMPLSPPKTIVRPFAAPPPEKATTSTPASSRRRGWFLKRRAGSPCPVRSAFMRQSESFPRLTGVKTDSANRNTVVMANRFMRAAAAGVADWNSRFHSQAGRETQKTVSFSMPRGSAGGRMSRLPTRNRHRSGFWRCRSPAAPGTGNRRRRARRSRRNLADPPSFPSSDGRHCLPRSKIVNVTSRSLLMRATVKLKVIISLMPSPLGVITPEPVERLLITSFPERARTAVVWLLTSSVASPASTRCQKPGSSEFCPATLNELYW